MYLTSVTQRDRLFDVATRWLSNRIDPGDGRFVTQVFVFESVIWAPTVRGFVSDILRRTHAGPRRLRRFHSKDELRQALCEPLEGLSERSRALLDQYRLHPDEFFPGTPADLALVSDDAGLPIAILRVKRVRRVAEKASRRIADYLEDRIRGLARSYAANRAAAVGVPLDRLVSSPEAMLDDFAKAEQVVSGAFRDDAPSFEPRDLRIDDVIGVKFVGSDADLARIERAITDHPLVRGVQREEHRGRYNDINLLVDLQLPPGEEIVQAERDRDWGFASDRGLPAGELARDFPAYVRSGERTVRAEVILTSLEELIESEFGRAIHEQRILEQRGTVSYSGRIASNASFLIEYLLMLGLSPTVELSALPVKMWGRYLPDVYSLAVWELFGIHMDMESVHALFEPPAVLQSGMWTPSA